MVDSSKDSDQDTAWAYGQREGCFQDHLQIPYVFQHCARQLPPLVDVVDSHGLIQTRVLPASRLPKATFELEYELFVEGPSHLEDLSSANQQAAGTSPYFFRTAHLKDLGLPLEMIQLRDSHISAIKDYIDEIRSRTDADLSAQWLPLSHTKDDVGEGLEFPPKAERLRLLLYRELDQERITATQSCLAVKQQASQSNYDAQDKQELENSILIKTRSRRPVPISPPLSPVSDDIVLFTSNADACTTDLTSEPSSPMHSGDKKLQEDLLHDRLDSDIEHPVQINFKSPTSQSLDVSGNTAQTFRSLGLEVPLLLSDPSSDALTADVTAFFKDNTVQRSDSEPNSPEISSNIDFILQEGFVFDLEACHAQASLAIESEQFDSVDPVSRVPVPLVDFTISDATPLTTTAKEHFVRFLEQVPCSSTLPLEIQPGSADMMLKWAPFQPGSETVIVEESLELFASTKHQFMGFEQSPTLCSGSYCPRAQKLVVLRLVDEEELEDNSSEELMVQDPSGLTDEYHPYSPSSSASSRNSTDLASLIAAVKQKRQFDEPSRMRALLPTKDNNATDVLLAGFMELRAPKRPRFAELEAPPTWEASPIREVDHGEANQDPAQIGSKAPLVPTSECDHQTGKPALSPDVYVPDSYGAVIISLGIDPGILRQIEKYWPAKLLIDRDHASHNEVVWSPGYASRKEVVSSISFEADISLTPTVGVLVTTLLKARQKPLPASKQLPQLRDRVLKVSRKYETSYVIVSEDNTSSEDMGRLSSTDIAAYADFVNFAVALRAGVVVQFVSGGKATLTKWIVSLMCQYTPRSNNLSRFLSARASTWELFFRRTGLNTFASQVLAGTLYEEAGEAGLRQFVEMPNERRVSRYSQLLGGRKLLQSFGETIDGAW